MIVDHPFATAIEDAETETLLFVGAIRDSALDRTAPTSCG